MRVLNEIIVHCSATRAAWMGNNRTSEKVAEIRRWHIEDRGWSDIGYHFLLDRDGTVAKGRSIARAGAHTVDRNANTIGACLIGGHGSSADDDFSEHFTPAQDKALRELIRDLRAQYGKLELSGHNQYAAKACPGFDVPNWWAADAT